MFTLKLITFINAILASPYPVQLMYIMALQLISGMFPVNEVVIFSTLSSYNAFNRVRNDPEYEALYSLFIGIMDIVYVSFAAHEYGAKATVQTYIASSFITILGLQFGAEYALIRAP
jgi:hypothetical protein